MPNPVSLAVWAVDDLNHRSLSPGSIPIRTRPPSGYHSGAMLAVCPTTCGSRQHSAERLSCLNDVLPPSRYIMSIGSRAQSSLPPDLVRLLCKIYKPAVSARYVRIGSIQDIPFKDV